MAKSLFVGNLPFSVGEDTLAKVFSEAGGVVSVSIAKDRVTGKSRGFAFIEMGSDEDGNRAIEMFNGYEIEGRKMGVRESLPKVAGDRPRGGSGNWAGRGNTGGRRDSRGGFDRRKNEGFRKRF